jgi:hypothetical protein
MLAQHEVNRPLPRKETTVRNHRLRPLPFLALLLLFLPLPARAGLAPVGAPFAIADEGPCSFITNLEVIATPKGAFEVVWVDDFDFVVKGRRFARNLQPAPPVTILPLFGGLLFSEFTGTWAGRYELVMNALDYGHSPGDPETGYRVQLDLEGDPLAPPARVKPPRFVMLAPAAGGDSLQFRSEPPFFGPPACQSLGLLASRVDRGGAPLSAESRVNRRASAWTGGYLKVDRLPDDTFIAAYGTCQKFFGLVARRLNSAGAPVGKPIDLPLPGGLGGVNFAARGAADFAVAATASASSPDPGSLYMWAVVNGQVFSLTRISSPLSGGSVLADLAASPAGGYLLLFQGNSGDPQRHTLFAQEFDAHGLPQGTPLAVTGEDEIGVAGAVASLPGGRWVVVTKTQSVTDAACHERLVVTVLTGD